VRGKLEESGTMTRAVGEGSWRWQGRVRPSAERERAGERVFWASKTETGDLRWDEFGNNENMEAINAYRLASLVLWLCACSRVE